MTTDPTADPASNTDPSNAFLVACQGMGTTKADNDACDVAALKDFDSVRAGEGLGTMTLPGNFDTMAVPAQLLAISNIERVDRGLVAIGGLSTSLNSLAQTGADNDTDPEFANPCHCDAGGANWAAAGNSVLLDDFYWMYDDGLGSFNEDCTASDMSGCWGHRHDIIGGYDAPLVMGAAVTYGTADGTSMATEYVSGDTSDQVAAVVALSVAAVSVVADTAKVAHASVTAAATGASATLRAATTAGDAAWSVSPTSCVATTHQPCTLSIRFAPPRTGKNTALLTVVGPDGTHSVALSGTQGDPRLTISASKTHVKAHQRVTVVGVVRSHLARAAVARQLVELQRRGEGGAWHDIAKKRSNSRGRAGFRVRPTASTTYRLKALSSGNSDEGLSAPIRVVVD
jgi:hypothetical protein